MPGVMHNNADVIAPRSPADAKLNRREPQQPQRATLAPAVRVNEFPSPPLVRLIVTRSRERNSP